MVADIESTVIFDETTQGFAGLFGRSRTVIEGGDDGFLSIIQTEEPTLTVEGTRVGRHDRVGLTPPMIAALVKWATTKAQP